MLPRKVLYRAHPDDNVATALTAVLAPGESVPVIDSRGVSTETVRLRSYVPTFFKVALSELRHGQAVVKWGHEIATVEARELRSDGRLEQREEVIGRGSVIHVSNFAPDAQWRRLWGELLVEPSNRIYRQHLEHQGDAFPFEMGWVKRTFRAGENICVSDLVLSDLLRRALFEDFEGNVSVGRALQSIPKSHCLHLGCLTGRGYRFPGNHHTIEQIRSAYRFLRGKIHEICEDPRS